MTGNDLIAMLQGLGAKELEKEIVIAPVPDLNGWVHEILPFVGKSAEGEIVLAPFEEPAHPDEVEIKWPKRPV